ncbi:MarR family transcriptional regulator [Clostridium tertium]|jgi:DNA-binding MarR family transcriptional regulator|uniref:MarR family winged helix-turn-helix transcriptional regulator n=1 Tax=Clostridium TaxID=1485 RepID=UPI00232C1E4D|nr:MULTISPECIES: MarR family transcriptional regulator [Clostridium]MDB1922116.1 MarR family transcriptional regulator [Clostridium tertium]MDB1926519.1 MarR family transcriptional regulator [Clostridium tertium]MDB1929672.1 MarR family transcriptional regulator [Clostridium tertium]MDU3548781.1 MarR family transcriptional regulator [Clostridium sp.]MDU6363083.1 MarR family transcriptional regulator [Clostridium sp.]
MEFNLDDSLGFILNKLNTKLKNELFKRFKEYEVTPEQWSVLNCLWIKDGITPSELAERIFKDKPNTNRILEKLQMKKLIVRKSNLLDKRSFQIFLTERGWELKDELIPKVTQLLDEATIGIEESKITEIKKILNQMYNNLK